MLALVACVGAPPRGDDARPEARGSATRPQLDAATAARYTLAQVLGSGGHGRAPVHDGWDPLADRVLTGESTPPLHYRVDPSAADGRTVFTTVQAAVNRAHGDAASGRLSATRIYIGIAPGRYAETVYVPAGRTPITLWGLGAEPQAVRIEYDIDAGMPRDEYIAKLGPVYLAAGLHDDIARLYRPCASAATIGTGCSAVMLVANDGFQLRRLSVVNRYRQSRATGGQAVAFKSEGADRVQLEQVHLLGHQDTLYLRTRGADHIARSFIHRSLIEGDVDFIFGPGTAYFLDSEIRWVGARRGLTGGYIAAPSTALQVPHGLVFERCRFTSEGAASGIALARQWFAGARCSPYGSASQRCRIDPDATGADATTLPQTTLEAVGKMVVLRSELGAHIDRQAPWVDWQPNPNAANHRPVQYDRRDFLRRLQATGHDPRALGYRVDEGNEPFLAEYRNRGLGSATDSQRP
ncbi:MAG: hypothetical protein HY021_15890 [Burkholderiales bacterium]|nr:hypothetical protein [Burkholderiales bacterium]